MKELPSCKWWILTLMLLIFTAVLTEGRNQKKNIQRTYDYGYALKFDGSSSYVSLPAISFASPLTFEFLVRPRSNGGTVLEFSDSSGRNGIRVSVISSKLSVLVVNDKGQSTSVTSSDSLDSDKWNYVIITVSNSRTVTFYISYDDGDSTSSTSVLPVGYAPFAVTRTINFIGKSRTTGSSNGARAFNGDLDEIRLWNKVLSSDEIAAGRLRPLRGDEEGFVFFYDCNQASGLTLTDVTDNQYHGALGGNEISKAPAWIVSGFAPGATCSTWGNFVQTFDKMPLVLSSTGMYWLTNTSATSLDSVPDVLAQIRLNIRRKACWPTVTPDGLAFQTSKDYVIFDFDLNTKSDTVVTWNGQQITDPNFVGSTGISIVKTITNTRTNAHTIEFLVPFTFSGKLTVSPNVGDTKIEIKLNESPFKNNNINGLCGDYDGNWWDDFGSPISQTWAVVGPSLFSGAYSFEESITSFDCDIQDYPSLYSASRPICENTTWVSANLQTQCYYDVCVAGEIAGAVRTAEQTYQDCLQNSSNANGSNLCNKPCPGFCSFNGQCINGLCSCKQPYIGKDCSQKASYPCFTASWPGEPEVILQPFTSTSSISNHYSYNYPRYSSANTNNEIQDTTVVYIYQQLGATVNAKNTSLVVINDLTLDGSGGKASLSTKLTNAVGGALTGVSVAVKDDSDDKYVTSSLNTGGLVTANWTWSDCCTDGFALTNLPLGADFCAALTFSNLQGITQGVVASQDVNGDQELTSFPLAQTINICGKNCTNTCVQRTSCDSCVADTNCGWCSDSEVCVPGSSVGPDEGKCRSWRYSYTTNRVLTSSPGFPVDPSTIEYFLNSSSSPSFDVTFSVRIPENDAVPLEALVLQDVSAAFASDLSLLRASIVQTFYKIVDIYPSTRIAIGLFSDKPLVPYGSPAQPDYTYNIRSSLTSDAAQIQSALNSLTVASGGDEPNSQLEALLLAAKRPEVGWSSSARKVIIMITKSSYHTPVNNSLLVDNNGDGEFPNFGTSENYPSISQVRSALLSANIIPLFITTPTLAPLYQNLVNQIGFGYVSSYTELNAQSIFSQTLKSLDNLGRIVRPVIYQQGDIIGSVTPAQYTGVSSQTRVTFQVSLSNTSSSDAVIVVPGFGSVTLTHLATDNPLADENDDITILTTDDVVLTLSGTSVYDDTVTTIITQLPNGQVFQYVGGSRGAQLTGQGPWTVSDPSGRVVYNSNNQASTSLLKYYLKDSCAACSTFESLQISTSVTKSLPQATSNTATCNEDEQVTINLQATSINQSSVVTIVTSLPSSGQLLEGSTVISAAPYTVLSRAVIYKPNANQHGAEVNAYRYDQFFFTVSDSEGQAVQAAVITVNVLPVNDLPVTRNVSVSGSEDQIVTFTLDASDVDGDALSYIIDSISSGTVCSGNAQTCAWSVGPFTSSTPSINFNAPSNAFGSFEIAYRALDGVGSSTVSYVSISLVPVNDLPVATPGSGSTNEDTPKQFTLDITDIDNTASQVGPVICSWNGPGILTDSTSAEIPYTNTPYNLPLGSNVVNFSPASNGNGSPYAVISFVGRDLSGTGSTCVSFTINVVAVNDAPQSFSDVASVVESTETSITLRGSDVDNAALSFYLCSGPTRGTLLNSDNSPVTNTITGVSGQTATVKYTPVGVENGQNYATFSFKTFDGQFNSSCSTISINVLGVQNAPSTSGTNPSVVSTNEDTSLDVTLACTDPDGDVLTFKIENPLPSNVVLGEVQTGQNITTSRLITGNQIRIQPSLNWFGTTSFTFTCTDGNNTATPSQVTITVVSVNDLPIAFSQTVITDENQPKVIILSGTDVENPTSLTYQIQNTVSKGTLQICSDQTCTSTTGNAASNSIVPSGAVKFTPDAYSNDNGTGVYTTFTFLVFDPQPASSAVSGVVTIGVTPVNYPPVANTPNSTASAPYNQDIVLYLTGSDPDNDAPLLIYVSSVGLIGKLFQYNSITNDRGNQIQGSNVPVTDQQRRVIYTTQTGAKSSEDVDSINYVVADPAGLTASGQVNVTLPNNVLPTANASPQYTIAEDTPLTISLTGVDLDDANNVFTAFVQTLPNKGSLYQFDMTPINASNTAVTDASNRVIFVPTLNENGNASNNYLYASFSYYVVSQNTTQQSTSASLSVSVTPVNDLPIVTVTGITIPERNYSRINLTAYDPDGDAFAVVVRWSPYAVLKFNYVNLDGTDGGPVVYNENNEFNLTHPYGTVGVTPDPYYVGITNFNLKGCDWSGCALYTTIAFETQARPESPYAPDYRLQWAQPLLEPANILLLASDPDDVPVQTSTLTIYLQSLPQQGKLYRTIDFNPAGNLALNATIDYKKTTTTLIFWDPETYLGWGVDFANFTYIVKDETNLTSRLATVHLDMAAPCSQPAVFVQPNNGLFNVTAGSGLNLYEFQVDDTEPSDIYPVIKTQPKNGRLWTRSYDFSGDLTEYPYEDLSPGPGYDNAQFLQIFPAGSASNFYLYYQPNAGYSSYLNGPDCYEFQYFTCLFTAGLVLWPETFTTCIYVQDINTAPSITLNQTSFSSTSSGVTISGVSVADDSLNYAITVVLTGTNSQSVSLLSTSGVNVVQNTASKVTITGTVTAINTALSGGIRFVPTATGSLLIQVNDNGYFSEVAQGPSSPLTANRTISVTYTTTSSLTSGSTATGAFIGSTSIVSAAVYGVYRTLKSKKVIPEEADPWENDDAFDATGENPLYGTGVTPIYSSSL